MLECVLVDRLMEVLAMSRAPAKVNLTKDELEKLKVISGSETGSGQSEEHAIRAKIVLMSAEGMPGKAIAEELGVTANTVSKWITRFSEKRMEGLEDLKGKGRNQSISKDIQLKIATILSDKPDMSVRAIQKKLKEINGIEVSHTTVQRVLEKTGFKENTERSWLGRQELEFIPKHVELLGLLQNPLYCALIIGLGSEGNISFNTANLTQTDKNSPEEYSNSSSLLIGQIISRELNPEPGEVIEERQAAQEIIVDLEYAITHNPDQDLFVIIYNGSENRKMTRWLHQHAERLEAHITQSFDTWLFAVEGQLKMLTRKGIKHDVMGTKADIVHQIIKNIRECKEQGRRFGWQHING
jgi:transposase